MTNYSANIKSKSSILGKLRSTPIASPTLPEVIQGNWIQFEDRYTKLAEVIQFVGGTCKLVSSVAEIADDLSQYAEFQKAKLIWSNVDELPGNINLASTAQPHDLEAIDFSIYRSHLAVAENGAVWVSDENIKHRVVFFIAQHLVLIVNRSEIVDNLHQAYSMIEIRKPGFNCFISGPSKTADIEQSLVIGAHGCRSMMMYVIDA